MKIGWGLAMGRSWGFRGSIIFRNWNFFNYAVAKDFQYWKCTRPKFPGCAIWKCVVRFFLNAAWGVTVGIQWGPMGSNMLWKFFCTCYAVAKYILEANIEAKSGWPLPKPSTNYPVLSTVLEGYNYIPWPPYKPPSTEQWTHCEVLISGIKSLNITLRVTSYEY